MTPGFAQRFDEAVATLKKASARGREFRVHPQTAEREHVHATHLSSEIGTLRVVIDTNVPVGMVRIAATQPVLVDVAEPPMAPAQAPGGKKGSSK